jgi:hypothetical protein
MTGNLSPNSHRRHDFRGGLVTVVAIGEEPS